MFLRHVGLPATHQMWVEVQLAEGICSENIFLHLLHFFSELGETSKTKHTLGLKMIQQHSMSSAMKPHLPKLLCQARAGIQDTERVFFPSHLSKIPLNFWDVGVVFKQAGRLNERFVLLAFILAVSQLLLRNRFL